MRLRRFLVAVPTAVYVCAFLAICLHFRSAWPWNLPVHEDGRHTLLGAVFYFEHAAGELPVDILLSAAVAGALLLCNPPSLNRLHLAWRFAVLALATDAIILGGSLVSTGTATTLHWVLQEHTRDGVPFVFGSHWGYHFLSEIALMLLAMALAGFSGGHRADGRLLFAAWGAFAVLCLVFGVGLASFTDPRFLGHEARETMTHTLTTVPLAMSVCLHLSGKKQGAPRRLFAAIAAGGFLLIAGYQALAAVSGGIGKHAQTTDPVRLVCTHFFEHSFGLLVVPFHAAALYLWAGRKTAR